ncbi:uncharacterized protein Bfra_005726 [Botrytis fragariae]|uniref:Uncharacterized protein n=1 Tax=Botrytis fragariae TaxID=1964551 RepID=A0A8H6ARM6_9HELO|nr:uncharacterized protein Bfra_005726 [Botrytis fragariae]KAF5872367.1 hypothetical protein Bfra_005726 [Botrytis fragariae]
MPSSGKRDGGRSLTPKERPTNAVKTRPSNSNSGEQSALQKLSSNDQVKKSEDSKNKGSSSSGTNEISKEESLKKLEDQIKDTDVMINKFNRWVERDPKAVKDVEDAMALRQGLRIAKRHLEKQIMAKEKFQELTKTKKFEEDIKTYRETLQKV